MVAGVMIGLVLFAVLFIVFVVVTFKMQAEHERKTKERNEYIDQQIEKESLQNSNIKHCKNCGYQIFPEEEKCSNCGTPKTTPKPLKVCNNCRRPLSKDDNFCRYCGTSQED